MGLENFGLIPSDSMQHKVSQVLQTVGLTGTFEGMTGHHAKIRLHSEADFRHAKRTKGFIELKLGVRVKLLL